MLALRKEGLLGVPAARSVSPFAMVLMPVNDKLAIAGGRIEASFR
jgi:hypothetical protein